MMKHFRFAIAIFVLPAVIGVTWNFFSLVIHLGKEVSVDALPFWIGLGSYFVFQIIFFKPIKTYVFGHELTHALVGIISGARLRRFRVSSSGGSVVLTKTGILIALAPYFVPLYTVFLIGAYGLGSRFWPLDRYHSYFLFAAGFTLSFHFALTCFALEQGQSDLRQFGVFFSGVVILAVNCLLLAGLLKLLFRGQVHLKDFFYGSWHTTEGIVAYIFINLRKAFAAIGG